jgi:hypothetical protein
MGIAGMGADADLSVPAAISASLTEFTFDSRPIYQHRRNVAEMIERLGAAGADSDLWT